MVAIAAKVDGQALVGGRRDRRGPRHWRIVLACSDDRIGCVSRRRQLVVCALFHANAGGGLTGMTRLLTAIGRGSMLCAPLLHSLGSDSFIWANNAIDGMAFK
jgi:hypothetical protein